MNKVTATLFTVGLLASVPALAIEADVMPDKPGLPSLGAIMGASGISVSGYIDTSYNYLSGSGKFTDMAGTSNRVFDTERNSFSLNMIDITVSRLPTEGFGGLVNLNFGPDAQVITATGTNRDEFDIQAAYVHYASGPLMVIAGKYGTMAGAEMIKSPANLNYSRSILFGYAMPFTHTGVRAMYAVGDKLTLMAGVNNGWDALKETTPDSRKTLELGVSTTPIKSLVIAASAYVGKEPRTMMMDGGPVGTRTLFDVVATYNVTDALSFVLNYDYASQENADDMGMKAEWSGVAGYANFKFSDKWRVALRAETFEDTHGFRTGVTQTWDEATLTLAYMPSADVELRGEVRADKSDQQSFMQSDGTAKDSQSSAGLQAIYKF